MVIPIPMADVILAYLVIHTRTSNPISLRNRAELPFNAHVTEPSMHLRLHSNEFGLLAVLTWDI